MSGRWFSSRTRTFLLDLLLTNGDLAEIQRLSFEYDEDFLSLYKFVDTTGIVFFFFCFFFVFCFFFLFFIFYFLFFIFYFLFFIFYFLFFIFYFLFFFLFFIFF